MYINIIERKDINFWILEQTEIEITLDIDFILFGIQKKTDKR